MSSISISDSDERSVLRVSLLQYAERPNLYGAPHEVEGLAVHVVHVLLTTKRKTWRFEETEVFWRKIAADLGFGDKCAEDDEARRIIQWWRWGPDEEASRAQVVHAYERIWAELHSRSRNYIHTKSWIEVLLQEPRHAGTPDVLATILWGLMSMVFESEIGAFSELLEKERRKVRGGSFRTLADLGTKKQWSARAPKVVPGYGSEPRVAAGIRQALSRIDAMDMDRT